MNNILITADNHYNVAWLDWLTEQAPKYDLVLLAGDVLDMHLEGWDSHQIPAFIEWTKRFKATGTPLAICSGNHDLADTSFCGEILQPELSNIYFCAHWLEFVRDENIIVSPETRLIKMRNGESVVVSSLHWYFHTYMTSLDVFELSKNYTGDYDSDNVKCTYELHHLLHKGYTLAKQNACPWIWLHHEPPGMTPLVNYDCRDWSNHLNSMIEIYRPTLVASGHCHDAPLSSDGSYHCQLYKTHCFNAGHRKGKNIPCHVIVKMNGDSIKHQHVH